MAKDRWLTKAGVARIKDQPRCTGNLTSSTCLFASEKTGECQPQLGCAPQAYESVLEESERGMTSK